MCRKELPSFGPHAAVTLTWALARLSYRPPSAWTAAFAAATARLLPAMSPLGLSLMLWSAARLGLALPSRWVRAAAAASAPQLRAGAAGWERAAALLEARDAVAAARAAAAASGSGGMAAVLAKLPRAQRLQLQQQMELLQQLTGRQGQAQGQGQGRDPVAAALQAQPLPLQPALLAAQVWALPQLLKKRSARPPAAWVALADAATQTAVRYTNAIASTSATAAGGAAAPAAAAAHGTLDPRTLSMLLQGWARMRTPLSEACLSAALRYIEREAAVAVAAGAGASATPAGGACATAAAAVGPQHVVLVLWSCAVAGVSPPPEALQRLTQLHAQLLMRQQGAAAAAAAAAAVAAAAAAAAAAGGGCPATGDRGDGEMVPALELERIQVCICVGEREGKYK